MGYLIFALVAAAIGGVAAFFVFRNSDEIVDRANEIIDEVAEETAKAVSHASDELSDELEKLKE